MTDVQQQDARAVAIDAAIVAAIRLRAPEFEAAPRDAALIGWLHPIRNRDGS
jgi:hypothetical protein